MKNLLIILIFVSTISCTKTKSIDRIENSEFIRVASISNMDVYKTKIDSSEYIIVQSTTGVSITKHK